MSNTFDVPSQGSTGRYNQVPITSYKKGGGWDAKGSISGMELIHKPGFIMIVNNQEVISESTIPPNNTVLFTDKFILQSMAENRTEKVQIMETFGESSAISFFDMKTKIYQISGTLIEANGGPSPNYYKWASAFKDFYEKHLRGTQLARNKKIGVLTVLDNIIYFYPINLNVSVVSSAPYSVTFSMNIIVIKHTNANTGLDSLYKFNFNLEEALGIVNATKATEEAKKAYMDALLPTSTATATEEANLFGEYRGLVAKLEYLQEQLGELTAKYAKFGKEGWNRTSVVNRAYSIAAVTEEAERRYTVEKNSETSGY